VKLDELRTFFATEFPQSTVVIEAVDAGTARVRQHIGDGQLRPGGTVSGPVLMATADSGMYAALLGAIGPVALAVTTSLHIDFLRKPPAGRDIVADARLLKVGRRLAVGEVTLYSGDDSEPVARASVTYSIPPRAP
jgi:acyl-coenzyme A thioesterase PaaI-like protein